MATNADRMLIALVRHGDYEQPTKVPSAHLPHPLTAKGREQARHLASQLLDEARSRGLRLHPVIDASSLLRAHETATIAANVLRELDPDTPVTITSTLDLAERSTGAAANLTVDAIEAAVRADPRVPDLPDGWKAHPRHRLPLPGAESLLQAGARVAAHVEWRVHELTSAGARDTLKVFIGHGGALRHAAVCMGALELIEVPGLSMHHCGYVLLERDAPTSPGGPRHWRKVGGAWKVRKPTLALD